MPQARTAADRSGKRTARPGQGRGALAVLVVAVGLSGPLAALAGLSGRTADDAAGPVLAVAPPWRDLDAIADRAGGRLVGPIRAPFAAFASGVAPDFSDRLLASGAWFVLDAQGLAQLCGAAA